MVILPNAKPNFKKRLWSRFSLHFFEALCPKESLERLNGIEPWLGVTKASQTF
jgi:hypothetical protein